MFSVEQICSDNLEKVREIYEEFRNKAPENYGYENPPIDFENFALTIKKNLLGGLVLFEDEVAKGLMIYSTEPHKVIEINVIHVSSEENANRTALLKKLKELLKDRQDWKIISYAMLGEQSKFVKDIALLDFKMVGQSITRFDFKSPIAFRVFRKAQTPALQGYNLALWSDEYKKQATEVVHLAFKNSKSAYFDPRFLSLEGTENVLDMILSNQYGKFLSSYSLLLIKDGNLEGVCFTTMVEEDKLNIPLIAVRKDTRNKGMGKLLLKSVLSSFFKLIGDNKIILSEINATTDTDNYPAINMYRRLGFKEDSFYAHSYLKNPNYKD